MTLTIYKLQPIVDDPRYEGFAVSKLPDDLPKTIHTRDWQPVRLTATWPMPKAQGRVRAFNDFPGINLGEPAFSERAVEALRDMLEPNGEILPIKTKTQGRYFYFNVLTVADVLDRERTVATWTPRGVMARSIDRFSFHEQLLSELTIFRIVEEPTDKFVTQSFVDRVNEHGLKGFDFIKVWPLPEGYHWDRLERAKIAAKSGASTEHLLKIQSVIVSLRLQGSTKPTAAEKKAVRQIMDEADALLAGGTPDRPDVGALEGHEYSGGEARLFFTCPNADALAEKLNPWLNQLKWPAGLYATKRYGPFTDATAAEKLFFKS